MGLSRNIRTGCKSLSMIASDALRSTEPALIIELSRFLDRVPGSGAVIARRRTASMGIFCSATLPLQLEVASEWVGAAGSESYRLLPVRLCWGEGGVSIGSLVSTSFHLLMLELEVAVHMSPFAAM